MVTRYKNLCDASAFKRLNVRSKKGVPTLVLDSVRLQRMTVSMGTGLFYNYAAKLVDQSILLLLQELADEMAVIAQYQDLVSGQVMNHRENRKVLHHLTRGQLGSAVFSHGCNKRSFYEEQRHRIRIFSEQIHLGELRGSTGRAFTHVARSALAVQLSARAHSI